MLTSVFRLILWLLWLSTSLTLLTSAVCAQPATNKGSGVAKSEGAAVLKELELVVRGRLFTHFHYTQMEPEPFNEFEIREVQLGFEMNWNRFVGMELLLEGLRSAQPQSLFGIDRNSFVFRFRRAWAWGRFGFTKYDKWEIRLGLIPDPWVGAMQKTYTLRGLSPLLSEHSGFYGPSDLGAAVQVSVLEGLVSLQYAYTNGEGLNMTEQNRGKNSTILLSLRPLRFRWLGEMAELNLHGSYRDGSVGAGFAKNHRAAAGLTLTHRRFAVGGEFVFADGVMGRDQQGNALGLWAHGYVLPRWLGLIVRYDRWTLDANKENTGLQRLFAGVYSDLARFKYRNRPQLFRLYLTYQYQSSEANAGPVAGVPQANEAHRVLLLLSIQGAWTSKG